MPNPQRPELESPEASNFSWKVLEGVLDPLGSFAVLDCDLNIQVFESWFSVSVYAVPWYNWCLYVLGVQLRG